MKMNALMKELVKKDLGEAIPAILNLILGRDFDDIERWLKLELNGYWDSNPALRDADEVPKYRQIFGQHYDNFGRPFVISQSELQFVNTTRARWGVIELEQMCKKGGNYSIQDPNMIKLIRDFFGVEVARFTFNAQQLSSVLSTIRTELVERAEPIVGLTEKEILPSNSEPIIELKPNFYGIGIDLRALGKKWKRIISRGKEKA